MNINKKLRDEFYKRQQYVFEESDGAQFMSDEEIADWWLEKFTSHNTELLRKIEGIACQPENSETTDNLK